MDRAEFALAVSRMFQQEKEGVQDGEVLRGNGPEAPIYFPKRSENPQSGAGKDDGRFLFRVSVSCSKARLDKPVAKYIEALKILGALVWCWFHLVGDAIWSKGEQAANGGGSTPATPKAKKGQRK